MFCNLSFGINEIFGLTLDQNITYFQVVQMNSEKFTRIYLFTLSFEANEWK